MSQKFSFDLPRVRPVSPIDRASLGIDDEPHLQPHPRQSSSSTAKTPWRSGGSLYDDDITETRSAFGSTTRDIESEAPMLISSGSVVSTQNEKDQLRSKVLQKKSRKFAPTWITAILAVVTSIFSVWYSHRVLVDVTRLPQSITLTPGTTVLVVNVLSHLVAFLCWSIFSDAIESLRWAMACRPEGLLLTSFLALSRATPLPGVAHLLLKKGRHQIWAFQRLLSFVLVTLLGLVLITNVSFKNVYTPHYFADTSSTNGSVNVIAGLAPVSRNWIQFVPHGVTNLFFSSYTMNFITDPRFVISIPPVSCTVKDCVSIFLPGGIDLVRQDNGDRNATLFSPELEGDFDAVVINNAPGYQLEFTSIKSVDPSFTFDRADCKMYMQSIGDGVWICMAERTPLLYVGWSICPSELSGDGKGNLCATNQTWTEFTTWNTTVEMLKRTATTAYSITNISILSVDAISEPISAPIDKKNIETYLGIVMEDVPNAINRTNDTYGYEVGATSFQAQWGLGWLLRLYMNDFQTYADGGISILRGFISIPLQFSTIVQQQAPGGLASLPEDMHTTATLANSSYRAMAEPWTVWVFAFLSFSVALWSIAVLSWVSFYGPHTPNSSFFPEIDITSKSSMHTLPQSQDDGKILEVSDEVLEDLGKLTRIEGLGNGMTSCVIDGVSGKRVYCGSYRWTKNGEQIIVLVTERRKVEPLNKHEKYA